MLQRSTARTTCTVITPLVLAAALFSLSGCRSEGPLELLELSVDPSLARAGTVLGIELLASREPSTPPTVRISNREATATAKMEATAEQVRYVFTYEVVGDEPEGPVSITALSQDPKGTELTLEQTVFFDFTAPTVTSLAGPAALSDTYSEAAFAFSCSEESCEFICSLQGAQQGVLHEEAACQSGISYGNLTEDDYTFSVVATDPAGNIGEAATLEWKVSAPAAHALIVSGLPSTVTAGAPVSLTIEALDNHGNRASSYTGTVEITSSDDRADLVGTYTFVIEDEGRVTLSNAVLFRSARTHSITITDISLPSLAVSIEGIEVMPASADHFALSGLPSSIVAGMPSSLTIEVFDAFGNRATNYRGTAAFSSSDDEAELPENYSFSAQDQGLVTLFDAVTLRRAGTHTVTVSDTASSSVYGSLAGVVVHPAPAHRLAFVVEPSDALIGRPIDPAVVLEVHDEFGNFVPNATGVVTLVLLPEGTGATLGGSEASIVAGIAEFDALTIDLVGTAYSLRAVAEGLFWPESTAFHVALVPKLDLVFPGGAWRDSPFDLDIEVIGEGFAAGATVIWDLGGDDVELTPAAIHPEKLDVSLPASLFSGRSQAVPVAVRHAGVTTETFPFHFGSVLPDTAQLTCYDNAAPLETCPATGAPFFGQDAQYGWDLHSTLNDRLERNTTYATEPVVVDPLTHLQWQGCNGGHYGSNCQTGQAVTVDTFTKVMNYCHSLSWGGFQDWRVPTAQELFTIVSAGRTAPSIDTTAFAGFRGDQYWSGSLWSQSALFVMFGQGHLQIGDINLHYFSSFVRCVRGTPLRSPDFRRSETSQPLVRDLEAGLMWQGCSAGQSGAGCSTGDASEKHWQQALSYCATLQWGGYDDWRLPDRNELRSKLDYSGSWSGHLDSQAFPATTSSYWSSSTSVNDASRAWGARFDTGTSDSYAKGSSLRVRCVRGGMSNLSHF